jgi:hypothetical protein
VRAGAPLNIVYPISDEKLAAHEKWFSQWRSPLEFRQRLDVLMQQLKDGTGVGDVQFFNDSAIKFVANAWVASRFATARAADAVRIVLEQTEQWPDCKLSIGSEESSYEITGAYEEGRLLGKEYKDAMSGPAMVLDDWAAALAAVPGSVERAAKLKASKNYDPGLAGLVIYVLNSGDYGWSVNPPALLKARAALHKASLPAKEVCRDVWVCLVPLAVLLRPTLVEVDDGLV